MVAGLNGAGLRVVMDVVYNHTRAAGTDPHSVLDQIVPGYYQRLLDDGTVATSTCCANTAPEHAMMGKLVVDSIVTWAKQYKVDGFRFDLMGHHPKANILAVRARAGRADRSPSDGVDGKKILLYGEGWNFGEVADDARFVQATQANMAGTGIGTFNDRLRDAVRGGGPFDGNPRIQGFASGLYTDPNGDPVNGSAAEQQARLLHYQDLIKVGLTGNLAGYSFTDSAGNVVKGSQVDYNGSPAGYTAAPAEAVTYVDAHDNEILYDALAYKLPAGTTAADRARMQVLALAHGGARAGHRVRHRRLGPAALQVAGPQLLQLRRLVQRDPLGLRRRQRLRRRAAARPPTTRRKWPYAQPLLADPALVPDCAAIDLAAARLRRSCCGSGRQLAAVRPGRPPTQVQRRRVVPAVGRRRRRRASSRWCWTRSGLGGGTRSRGGLQRDAVAGDPDGAGWPVRTGPAPGAGGLGRPRAAHRVSLGQLASPSPPRTVAVFVSAGEATRTPAAGSPAAGATLRESDNHLKSPHLACRSTGQAGAGLALGGQPGLHLGARCAAGRPTG